MNQAAVAEPLDLPRSAEAAKPAEELVCPYPGLRPFTEQEERWYFGRESQRDECIRRLQQHRFLAVVGSSGSGKSSLVRAGLMPDLARGLLVGADERWQQTLMRPGADPLNALAHAVAKLGDGQSLTDISKLLKRSKTGLIDAVKLTMTDADAKVLLVVDQFEELFRLGKEEQTPERWHRDRVSFVELLLEARESSLPIYIVLTMRTDFLEDCTMFPNLPEALNAGQYLVPNLTRAQMERAITTPAKRLGIRFSGVLVRQILGDAAQLRDALPVVQHAIMRTWKRWQDAVRDGTADRETIEAEHYDAIGGASEALDQHGDEILSGKTPRSEANPEPVQLGEKDIPVAKLVFQRLTLTNADGKVTRSPTSFENLVRLAEAHGIADARVAVARVVDVFRADACRFLMPPADEARESSDIDISHEAVFRVWRKLSGDGTTHPGWIAEEHQNRRRYARLIEAALLERDGGGQLMDDHLLADTEMWWRSFAPKVEWASRCHVLDKEAERIVEDAKGRFHELERQKKDDQASRDSVLESYRVKLAEWHKAQFEIAADYLKRSADSKAAQVAELKRLEGEKRKAELKKWYWAGGGAVLVTLCFVAFQVARINILQGQVEAASVAKAAATKAADEATQRADKAKAALQGLQQQITDAQKAVLAAEARAAEAKLAEQRAQASVTDLEAKLYVATKDLTDKSAAAEALRKLNLAQQAEITKKQTLLATATAQHAKLDQELSAVQRELDDKKSCLRNCKLPFGIKE